MLAASASALGISVKLLRDRCDCAWICAAIDAFSDAVLPYDQDRAVALGNAGDRALNLSLNRGKRSSSVRLLFVCRLSFFGWLQYLP